MNQAIVRWRRWMAKDRLDMIVTVVYVSNASILFFQYGNLVLL